MKESAILYAKQPSRGMALGLIYIFIALFNYNNLFGETRTASLSGNWNNPITWGGSAVPLSTDDVTINTGVIVTMDVNGTCKSVTTGTASGTAVITGNNTLNTGKLTINNGGGTSQTQIIFSIGSGTTLICTSIAQVKGNGNGTVSLIVNGTLKNSGTTSLLNAFTCNAGSTVEYNGGDQTLFQTTYSNLILSGSGTKSMTGIANVNGNLSIIGTVISINSTDFTIGGNLDVGVGTTLTINSTTISGTTSVSGKLTLANTGTKTFNGNVTINSGGTWSETNDGSINYAGNLQNEGSFIASSGVHTFNGNGKTISGNVAIPCINISGTTTNNNTLTVSSTLAGASELRNNGTLNFGGASIKPTLTATAMGNRVNYNGPTQTVKATTYDNLTVSGTLTKKLEGNTTINGDLTVISGTLNLSTYTVNRATFGGTISVANDATLKIDGTNTFPANFSTHTFGKTSTIEYNGTDQLISGETYGNLTTSGTRIKTIAATSAVTVNGNLTTNGLLTINSDASNSGSLIVNGTSSGNVTYKRWMNHTGTTYSRWYIASAPVIVASGFETNTSKIHVTPNPETLVDEYDFASYSESDNDWNYVPTTSTLSSSLTPGEGYLISLNPGSDGILQFKGTLNGDFAKSLTSSSANKGWHAVGNPYTSAIEVIGDPGLGSFLDVNKDNLNPDYAAIYVWNEDATYTGTQQFYKVIGNSGYTPAGDDAFTQLPDHYIQAGQGFLINIKDPSTTPSYPYTSSIAFNKAMQVHQPGLSLKSSKLSWHGITLLAQSHGQTRSTAVAFNDQMTTSLDVTYDAGLLASDYFQVYTHLVNGVNEVDFAIQCLPDQQYNLLSVPVGVDLPEGGDLVFKASGIILPEGLYPVIEDKQLGIKTALKTEADSYTVTLVRNTTGTGRFYLSVEGEATWNPEVVVQKKYTASFINNRVVLNGAVEPGTRALLFDSCGRKVGEYPLENLNRNEIMVSGLSQRVYLLKIEGRNDSQVLKLVSVRY